MRTAYVIAFTALKTGATWESPTRFTHASTVDHYIAAMRAMNDRQAVQAVRKPVDVADDAVLDESLIADAGISPGYQGAEPALTKKVRDPWLFTHASGPQSSPTPVPRSTPGA